MCSHLTKEPHVYSVPKWLVKQCRQYFHGFLSTMTFFLLLTYKGQICDVHNEYCFYNMTLV